MVAKRAITPSWQQELPCESGSCWAVVESGAPGTLWARTLDGYDGHVLAVNAQGETVAHYETEIGGTLLAERDGSALLAQWDEGNQLRISRFDTEGAGAEQTLTLPEAPTEIRLLTVAPSDEGLRVAVFNKGSAYAAQYDRDGMLVWRQTNLRAAQQYPYGAAEGVLPNLSYALLTLTDGALVIGLPKYRGDDAEEGDIVQRAQGVSVLDSAGNLLWDGFVPSLRDTAPLLAVSPDGGLAIVAGEEDVLSILAVTADGDAVQTWTGQRVDYFALHPSALCVDPAGAIYVTVLSGERDDAVTTICRMTRGTDGPSQECASVDFAPKTGEDAGPARVVAVRGIACPAPGRVVLASSGPSGAGSWLTAIDF